MHNAIRNLKEPPYSIKEILVRDPRSIAGLATAHVGHGYKPGDNALNHPVTKHLSHGEFLPSWVSQTEIDVLLVRGLTVDTAAPAPTS